MKYSLSVERIVKALRMCGCSEISKGLIHIVLGDTYEKFITKKDSEGNEYYTLKLSETENETVEDFKNILKNYNVCSNCTSTIYKAEFDKYFKSIALK